MQAYRYPVLNIRPKYATSGGGHNVADMSLSSLSSNTIRRRECYSPVSDILAGTRRQRRCQILRFPLQLVGEIKQPLDLRFRSCFFSQFCLFHKSAYILVPEQENM